MTLSKSDVRVLIALIGQNGFTEPEIDQGLGYRFNKADVRGAIQTLLAQGSIYFNSKRQLFIYRG